MGWGGVQEGVGLLAAMDVFPDATLKEVGCLLLELCPEHNVLPGGFRPSQLPLVGASPDGVLLRQNGDVEIVEVKCVCPYTSNGGGGWPRSGPRPRPRRCQWPRACFQSRG